ncbi:MAG: lamin tail domain-containing protein [Dehalococcoidia bacterium]|nr:MAG: lamin tail domain-containing protein [Dehalococcoidia bacterium]
MTRGRISLVANLEGHGQSLLLTADAAATVWVQQTVAVTPRGWFSASALLAPLDGAEAAWVRIAWYASGDGSGAQLSTDDSPAASTAAPMAISRSGHEVVSTGPAQAPAEAHSARVRILLRAATERGATVLIDDVTFEPTEPVEAAPPTPPSPPPAAARVRATPTASSASDAGAEKPSDDSPVIDVSERTTKLAAASVAQRQLRITEVVSNPADAGADSDFEWVEVMNTGTEPASLAGISLRDRRLGNLLPPYLLEPGAVVVIAAPGARIAEGVPLIRLRRAIGNGLGNTGDRVALVATDGREIDAVAYGEGIEDGEEPLPAPASGQSIERRFSPAGILIESRLSDTPTPGQPPDARVRLAIGNATGASTLATPEALTVLNGLGPTWRVMLALAGGLVLGAGAARAASLARRRA